MASTIKVTNINTPDGSGSITLDRPVITPAFTSTGIDDNATAEALQIEDAQVTCQTGDLVFATAGKGICLGVTSNTDANTLDDYEEGTWTPVLTPHAGTGPTTSTTNSGSYTKVGRLVTVIGYIQIDSISGVTSGIVNISLPFTPVTSAGYMPSGPVTPNGMTFTRPDIVTLTIYSGATAGFLTANNAGGWGWEAFSIFSAGDALRFSLSYYA